MDQDQPKPATPESSRINPNKLSPFSQAQSVQSVMNPISIPSEDASPSWKPIVLDVLVVIFAGLFGYTFNRFFAGTLLFWWMLPALLLWSAISVIQAFLQKNRKRRFLIVVLEILAVALPSYQYGLQTIGLAAVLALLALLWGYYSGLHEMESSVEIRFFTASGKVIGKVVTAAVIFGVVVYASVATDTNNLFVSQNNFDMFFGKMAQAVNSVYPGVSLSGSASDFAQSVARAQLKNNPAFQTLPADQQNTTVQQFATQILGSFSAPQQSSSTGVVASGTAATAPNPSEPASQVFYNYFTAQLAKMQDRLDGFFIGAWGLVVFFVLRGIGIIVVWAGEVVTLVIYELLLSTGFMRIKDQATTKESISY